MASIPLPALDLRPPAQQPGALDDVSKLMALRSMLNQNQLQQQELQKNQLGLQDQATARQLAQNPKYITKDANGKPTGFDYDQYSTDLSAAGVSPQMLQQIQNMRKADADMLLARAQGQKAQLENDNMLNDQARAHLDSVKGETNPAIRQQKWDVARQWAASKGVQIQLPAQAPDDATLSQYEIPLAMHSQAVKEAHEAADTAKSTTEALLNQNKIDVINAWKQNPQQVLAQVDSIVSPTGPNATLNARTKSQVQFALGNGDVDSAKAAIKQAAEQVGAIEKDVAVNTNPQIQAGKVAVAAAEGQARANTEAAMRRGSNAAVAQVPPDLVAPATSAATKAGEDYAQAKSVSDRLAAMMDAAKKGNVVSYQLIPQEGALQITTSQGVHRINMAEIQNYGGGSLWQRMEGHLGKALTGKSIPDSVLGDMEEMQKIQAEGSATKYNNTLKTINDYYGAKFKPVEMDTMKTDKQQKASDFFSQFGGQAKQ